MSVMNKLLNSIVFVSLAAVPGVSADGLGGKGAVVGPELHPSISHQTNAVVIGREVKLTG
jgi:hypothetical protein